MAEIHTAVNARVGAELARDAFILSMMKAFCRMYYTMRESARERERESE
jgi:hypothetical protein